MVKHEELNKELELLLTYSKRMQDEGLVVGPGGNTSIKDGEGIMWISPSGIPFDEMQISDFVPVNVKTGKLLDNKIMPSSEIALHLFIYKARSDVSCIFHAHPPTVIALSSVDVEIEPLFPDFVVYLGGHVPQTPYVTPCSEEMASLVVKHLKELPACILKNHGCVTVGKSIKEAYTRTVVLESGAQIYYKAIQVGKPRVLSKVEIKAILNLDIEKYRQKLLQG
ncbi:MAG: class II aldolase/adducin family protein [Candidatus Hodarchaeota archaeon]